ncbi:uncharacterized protein LOC133306331, partial [Gastrolobium bilobum]|uniref:uncharacterized protein LOC133306331 n=1 Tax=Gastrolobium bilobum TaxID=150636 RepID=UPI002AB2260F
EVLHLPSVTNCPYQEYLDSREVYTFQKDLKQTVALDNANYYKGSLCKGSMKDIARNLHLQQLAEGHKEDYGLPSLPHHQTLQESCTYIDTTQPIPANLRRSPTRDSEEETSVASLKETTKTTPTKSSSSSHVPARRTIPYPTKVKKDAPVATDGKQGKKKSPAKPPQEKGNVQESEDNEPLAKRLKIGRKSAPKLAAKDTSPSSSDSTFSDIPSPPPAHSPLQQITPQPSPRQQQGEGQKDKEAAPAAETPVVEQEAQPQKKDEKGKGILVESPKKKAKPSVPRQINLGGPLLYPINRPDTTGDEALARALAEEEGMAVPPLMGEHIEAIPSSSRPPEDEPGKAPEAPLTAGSSQ